MESHHPEKLIHLNAESRKTESSSLPFALSSHCHEQTKMLFVADWVCFVSSSCEVDDTFSWWITDFIYQRNS